MAESSSSSFQSGFQGSETSRVEVTIYSFGDEPGLFQTQELFTLHGPESRGGAPVLTRVATTKALGEVAGSFVVELKSDEVSREYVASVSDDDWVDIVFTRHGRKTHVMRGQVEDIRRETSVGPSGATMDVIRISGRDFGRIFDITSIWFDILTDGALGVGATGRVLEANKAFYRDPATTVESILAGFLRELRDVGRSHWDLPKSMPGVFTKVANEDDAEGVALFIQNCCFFDRDFVNYPERSNTIDFSFFPGSNQSVWSFMTQWADLPVCEIYTELLQPIEGDVPGHSSTPKIEPNFGVDPDSVDYPKPLGDLAEPNETTPDSSAMAVIFRDRPFPTLSRKTTASEIEKMEDGPWFKRIPMISVPPQHIQSRSIGRSGLERKNAFYVGPRLLHELSGGYFDLQGPLWNPDDMKRHGFRRSDTVYNYTRGADADDVELSRVYKQRVRDFHCINHLFYNGTLTLGHGRPDVRVGTKFRITEGVEATQQTYYVEMVNHTWSLREGLKTSLGVTRGWIGSDTDLIFVMNEIIAKYRRPVKDDEVEPQPEPQGPVETTDADSWKNAEQYEPFTALAEALFTEAADIAGVPADWANPLTAEGKALHDLLGKESKGYVGIPNYTYGERKRRFTKWAEVHAELRAGKRTTSSSATGLGQLILANVDAFYPSGRAGIGVALEEAVGMLRYIKDPTRHGTPSAALIFWLGATPHHY